MPRVDDDGARARLPICCIHPYPPTDWPDVPSPPKGEIAMLAIGEQCLKAIRGYLIVGISVDEDDGQASARVSSLIGQIEASGFPYSVAEWAVVRLIERELLDTGYFPPIPAPAGIPPEIVAEYLESYRNVTWPHGWSIRTTPEFWEWFGLASRATESALDDPEVPPRSPSRLSVDLQSRTITLDGVKHEIDSELAVRWVAILAQHRGQFISANELAEYDPELIAPRTDRLRKCLPDAIDCLIESRNTRGSRINI
jgi:hypothetical protein